MPVQIISPSPRAMQQGQIGQALGMGINKNFPDPQQMVQRQMLQDALQKAKQSVNQPGATPLDKMFSFMEAGAGIPGSERYMGALLPLVQQLTEAEASRNAPFGQTNNNNFVPSYQGETNPDTNLNNYLNPLQNQQNPFYPNVVGGQEVTGNLPQSAREKVIQPILSTQDLLNMAPSYAKQRTQAGRPTTTEQAYEQLTSINNDRKLSNKEIEKERVERVNSQREYGDIAEDKLLKLMPNADDEEKAYIRKKAESYAGQNRSEADIQRIAAGEAIKYKNLISKAERGLTARRSFNKPLSALSGTSREDIAARNDLRAKIQPLLDAGLYDRARQIVNNKGYYPEEREAIVSNGLSEGSIKSLNQLPVIQKESGIKIGTGRFGVTKNPKPIYSQETKDQVTENLRSVLTSDPNTNLILLRKAYEDKKVDWDIFKDSLNMLMEDGSFTPNDDQFKQLTNLEQPPLNRLDTILHGLGIIGR